MKNNLKIRNRNMVQKAIIKTIKQVTICFCLIGVLLAQNLLPKTDKNSEEIKIDKNYYGWNIPDLRYLDRIGTEEIEIPSKNLTIVLEKYRFKKNFKKLPGKHKKFDDYLPRKFKLNKSGETFYKGLQSSNRSWKHYFEIYRLKNSKKVVYYFYSGLVDLSKSCQDYVNSFLKSRKNIYITQSQITGDVYFARDRSGSMYGFYVDIDDDGIYESRISHIFEKPTEFIEYVIDKKAQYLDKNKSKPSSLFISFKKAWIKYLDFPSNDNLKNSYSIFKEYVDTIENVGNETTKNYWKWFKNTFDNIQTDALSGNENAINFCLQLHRIRVMTISGILEKIFTKLILIQPEKLLRQILKNKSLFSLVKQNRKVLKLKWIIDSDYGLEFVGLATRKYIINQKKIQALLTVKNKELTKLRDKCIEILKNDQKNLIKYCFVNMDKLK
jgi:hypothetical protein